MFADINLQTITILALVAASGVLSQWIAWRLRIPAILFLTLVGLIIGPITGLTRPSSDFGVLFEPVVSLFVAIILFEGGLNLKFHEFRQAAGEIRRLVFPGVLTAWGLGVIVAHYVGGLSWPVATLFAAIIVVTGPTVVMPLLRHAGLKKRPAAFLKWEGIVNDPIGALLAVLVFDYLTHLAIGEPAGILAAKLVAAVFWAFAFAAGGAFLVGRMFGRGLVPEYLKPPLLLCLVVSIYALARAFFSEAGLLAVTVMGLFVGNMSLPSIGELRRFKEYLTILIVSSIFILLTADLDMEALRQIGLRQAALLAAVLFLVRPLSVLLSSTASGMTWRERLLVGWIAPRGIVAAAMAGFFGPRLEAMGYAGAGLLVPLVFGLILLSVALHGSTIAWMARKLGLAFSERNGILIVGASDWSVELVKVLTGLEIPVVVSDTSWHRLRPARLSGIRTYFGEILSEQTDELMEWNEMGCLLAVTSNDSYNALVCSHFAREFGRNAVFQIPIFGEGEHESRALPRSVRGTEIFDREIPFEELQSRYYQGWRFKKTKMTENYTMAQFEMDRACGAMNILLLKGGRNAVFQTQGKSLQGEPGDILISFGPPETSVERVPVTLPREGEVSTV